MQFYFTINNSKHVFSSYILKVINKDSLEEAKKEKKTQITISPSDITTIKENLKLHLSG
jgi:cell division protein FtsI/penicillin-binding protein 2